MRRLVIGLLVFVALLVAADFGAAAAAESAVSREMREQIGLPDDPSVRINGFPFLTQALAGRYSSIDVVAERIAYGELRELQLRAELRDVTAPLSEVLGSGPPSLTVAEADGVVRIGADDLERLVPGVERMRIERVDDEALRRAVERGGARSLLDIDPDSAARIVGTTAVLGQEFEVAVLAELRLDGGRAEIRPRDVRLGADDAPPLPAPVQATLEDLFTLRVDPGRLPLAVTPTSLEAVDGALEIGGTARDLSFGGAAGAPVTGG